MTKSTRWIRSGSDKIHQTLFCEFFMFLKLILIGLGGSLGAILRFCLTFFFSSVYPKGPSLLVNVLGCFLAGFLFPFLERSSGPLGPFLFLGFLGALTTFSSFSLELLAAFQKGDLFFCFQHLFLTNFLVLCSLALGFFFSKTFVSF